MKTHFVKTLMLTEEERKKVGEMSGKIVQWILEGQSLEYMAENLKLSPSQVVQNIDEMLYILKRNVGWKRFLRILFWK